MTVIWDSKPLGELLQKMETVNPLQSPDEEFCYIDVSSVSNKTFQIEETQKLLGKDAPSRARRLVNANDVLFATIRPTLQRIAIVPEELDGQVCSTGYFVMKAKRELDHRFLFYFLFTEAFMNQMEALQKGASYPAVTDAEVRAQIISFPPLPEQQRIVGILDEAFDGIATAKANAERNLQNARALFESHLAAVFTQVDSSHVERRLGDVCEEITVGHVGTMAKHYRESGVPFLRSQNIRPFNVSLDNVVFIEEAFHQSLAKSQLRPGDVAVVRTGYPGTAAVMPESLPVCNCSDLVIVRPGPGADSHYLALFFNSRLGKELVAGRLVGAAQKHFNVTAAKQVYISFPPVPEQRRLVTKIEGFGGETQRLESIYQQKLNVLDALKKYLLHQAFTGQL